MRTEHINFILLLGCLLLLIELSIFKGAHILFIILAVTSIYYGHRRKPKKRGKILFLFGVVVLCFTVLNMVSFRIVLILFFIYLLIQYFKREQQPLFLEASITNLEKKQEGPIVIRKPLFQNKLFGNQRTPEMVYEWNDICIQSGIGSSIIDLSNTVLPKGESVICIRQFMGKIQILVPYDIEVSIHHSVFWGRVTILQYEDDEYMNRSIHVQTQDYNQAEQKVKIMTSLISGDIEVRRI